MNVRDMHGIEIQAGQTVIVHQEEGLSRATVIEVFHDNPTTNAIGHWVDIDKGHGPEGMMSYILEVAP